MRFVLTAVIRCCPKVKRSFPSSSIRIGVTAESYRRIGPKGWGILITQLVTEALAEIGHCSGTPSAFALYFRLQQTEQKRVKREEARADF